MTKPLRAQRACSYFFQEKYEKIYKPTISSQIGSSPWECPEDKPGMHLSVRREELGDCITTYRKQ